MPDTKELLAQAKQNLSASEATTKLAADGQNDPNLGNSGYTTTFNQTVQQRFQGVWTPLLSELYSIPAMPMETNSVETSYMSGSLSGEDLSLQETESPREVSWSTFKTQLGKGKAGAAHEWTEEELIIKGNQAEAMGLSLQDTGARNSPVNISVNVITTNIANYLNTQLWDGDVPFNGAMGIVGIFRQHKKVNLTVASGGTQNARYNAITYANDATGWLNFFTNVRARYLQLRKMGVEQITLMVPEGNVQRIFEGYYKNYLGLSLFKNNYDSKDTRLTEIAIELEPWLRIMEISGMPTNSVYLYPNRMYGQSTYERYFFASKKTGMKELEAYIRTDRRTLAESFGFAGEYTGTLNDNRAGMVKMEMITFPAFAFTAVGLGCYYSVAQFVTTPTALDITNETLRQKNTGTINLAAPL